MTRKIIFSRCIFIILLLVTSCQSTETRIPTTIEELATSTALIDATVTPEITNQTVLKPNIPFHKIITSKLREIWWSRNSRNLYYMLKSGEIFSYSLLEETAVQEDSSEVAPRTPHPDIVQQLPANAHSIGTSPNRNKTLYVIPVGPTPKPPAYPKYNQDVPAQLWFWQDGQSQLIGEIADCIIGYWWTASEERVLIESEPFDCKNAYTTLLDLNAFEIVPLFPEMSWSEVLCCDPSPDGSRMTYIIDKELYFLDPVSLETTKLSAPPLSYLTSRWIDNQRMLVIYPDILGEPITVGILNLEANSVAELFSETDAFLEGEQFYLPTVSPNGRWLAFVSGEDFNHLSTVWILRMPDS